MLWYMHISRFVTKQRNIILLVFVVVASRIPFIFTDYGIVPDSYRVVNAARKISEMGVYTASRFPGNPVNEIITSLVVSGEVWFVNSLSVIWGMIAVIYFVLFLKQLGIQYYILIGLALAFVPVIFINSTSTIDYMWALAGMMGSLYYIRRGQPLLAGLLLGLAIGSRITSGAFIFPSAFYLWQLSLQHNLKWRRLNIFIWSSLAVATLSYLPTWIKYGSGFFVFAQGEKPSLIEAIGTGTVGVWGTIGTLTIILLLVGALFHWRTLWYSFRNNRYFDISIVAIITICIYGVAFIRLPHQPGYLIPIVPFVLLLVAIYASRFIIVVSMSIFIIASFIGFNNYGVPTIQGPIINNYNARQTTSEYIAKLIMVVSENPTPMIVVAGYHLPRIEVLVSKTFLYRFVYLIESEDIYREYESQGIFVYYISGIENFNASVYKVDLPMLGAHLLEI